jgi:hypothetical protein
MCCGISLTFQLNGRRRLFKRGQVLSGQLNSSAAKILFYSRKLGCAWDRNDPWRFCKEPCKDDLSGGSKAAEKCEDALRLQFHLETGTRPAKSAMGDGA